MVQYKTIQSKDNTFIKRVVRLSQNALERHKFGMSVIYGLHLIEEALKFAALDSLIINANSKNKYDSLLVVLPATVKVYSVAESVMQKFELADGVPELVGLVSLTNLTLPQDIYTENCLLLDNIQDPGNLGTILRSAMACGFINIVLSPGCVDVYSPKVFRASQGIQLGLKIYTRIDLEKFIDNYQYSVFAAVPNASMSIFNTNLTKPLIWIFGNEGNGISDNLLKFVINKVGIPMCNNVESLNVAMAATVCLFETYRQRLTL